MASSSQRYITTRNSEDISESRQNTRTAESMAQSSGIADRLRRNEESWVAISSQPSSSSLSSIGDEIVTTGLRVQRNPNSRRRRRTGASDVQSPIVVDAKHTGASSQEEYEESESEEDHVMTSSNEHIIPSTRLSKLQNEYYGGSDSDDDDENATALGRRTEPDFTPQPNAFSHPPTQRVLAPDAYYSRSSQPAPTRPPFPNRSSSRTQYASYNQADHDAALRASLTTLLSIGAAAARGLPKRNQGIQGGNTMTGNQPMSLGFVPESELGVVAANSSRPLTPSTRPRSSPSISSEEAIEKGKRKAPAVKPTGEKARVAKKKKVQLVEEAMISPTLLTWVMSAGVVVLVSVVGFGAGYVIGREVGRGEALSGLNSSAVLDTGSCGREVARSGTGTLRRFRWGGSVRSIVA